MVKLRSVKFALIACALLIAMLYLEVMSINIDGSFQPIMITLDISLNETYLNHTESHQSVSHNISYLNEIQRIEYYMGKWYHHGIDYINSTWLTFKQQHRLPRYVVKLPVFNDTPKILNFTRKGWAVESIYRVFLTPFMRFLNLSKSNHFHCTMDYSLQAMVAIGDEPYHQSYADVPVFVKTRALMPNIESYSAILIQEMEYGRHWQFACRLNELRSLDVPWKKKQNIAMWRGATTGSFALQRLSFVRQYFNHSNTIIDVGFSNLIQLSLYPEDVREELEQLIKPRLPETKMLQYKYVVSIEGNDVASNLNWLLMSNSVVFMPKPTKETWLMEGLLKPYVHYIPLTVEEIPSNDTVYEDEKLNKYYKKWKWNLEEQLQFCMDNDELCHTIAQNSQQFMSKYKFCDQQHEAEIHTKMLDIYCQHNKLSFNPIDHL